MRHIARSESNSCVALISGTGAFDILLASYVFGVGGKPSSRGGREKVVEWRFRDLARLFLSYGCLAFDC